MYGAPGLVLHARLALGTRKGRLLTFMLPPPEGSRKQSAFGDPPTKPSSAGRKGRERVEDALQNRDTDLAVREALR